MVAKFRKVSPAVQPPAVKKKIACIRCRKKFVSSAKFIRYCPKCKIEVNNDRPYGSIVKHHLDSGVTTNILVEHG